MALKPFAGQKYIATQVLWGTFGTDVTCFNKLAALPAQQIWVNLAVDNGAGRRNNRLKSGELLRHVSMQHLNNKLAKGHAGTIAAFSARIAEACNFTLQYPHITWTISVGLETNDTPAAAKRRVLLARAACPHHPIVYNPMLYHGGTGLAGADVIELHGEYPNFPKGKMCIANLDGTQPRYNGALPYGANSISMLATRKWVRKFRTRCAATLLWDGAYSNCLAAGTWVAPKSRQCGTSSKVVSTVRKLIKRYNKK